MIVTTSLMKRVMNRILIGDDSGHWIWMGKPNSWGYGRLNVNGREERAHRAAYEAFVGPIPEGLTIDHLCRVKLCVNPDHLEVVTHRENILRNPECRATMHAVKTQCPKGHEYDFINNRGQRCCKTCSREQQARYRIKRTG